MRDYRSNIEWLVDGNSDANAADIMWVVLQCHRIFNEFSTVHFRGHPLIVKEINQFMIEERVDPTLMEEQAKEIKALKSTVQRNEQTTGNLKKTVENHGTEIATLKKRVK